MLRKDRTAAVGKYGAGGTVTGYRTARKKIVDNKA